MENQKKKHNLTEKHPVIAALLLGFLLFIAMQILSAFVDYPVGMLLPWYPKQGGILGTIAAAAVGLLCYKGIFKPEYQGSLRGGDPLTGLKFVSMHVPALVISSVIALLGTSAVLQAPSFSQVSMSFMAGVLEESAFRGFILATLMRQWRKDETKMIPAAIASAVAFGLIHALNLTQGADLLHTLVQVIESGCVGFFLAAVFMRCGNLLPVMLIHTVQNIAAASVTTGVTDQMVVTGGVTWTNLVDLVIMAGIAAIGAYLLRPAKRSSVTACWEQKWTD